MGDPTRHVGPLDFGPQRVNGDPREPIPGELEAEDRDPLTFGEARGFLRCQPLAI